MSKPSLKRSVTPLTNGKETISGIKPHWSVNVYECVVCIGPDGTLNLPVEGGSDNGEFAYFGALNQDRITYLSGRIEEGDVILEIQGQKVAGFTQRDVVAWLNHCCRNGSPVVIRATRSGLMNRDLRQYLNTRFPKSTPDYDLQTAVRDNLYLRTVPCTTRQQREGEVNGVDYTFLSTEEFMALERSGSLLESGIYEGNHYGTPKPRKESPLSPPRPSHLFGNLSGPVLPGVHPSSEGKRRRNRSSVEAMTAKSDILSDSPSQPLLGQQSNTGSSTSMSSHGGQRNSDDAEKEQRPVTPDESSLGPLPDNWEKAYTEKGELYFIDHNKGTSQWLDPRLPKSKKSPAECDDDELPYGWEKIDDPHYGTYFIDHVNKKTQYENPVLQAKRLAVNGNKADKEEFSLPWRHDFDRYGPRSSRASESEVKSPSTLPQDHSVLNRTNSLSHTPSSVDNIKSQPHQGPAYNNSQGSHHTPSYVFTRNPAELKGDMVHTSLVKSQRGFGFTIVGGDEGDVEEFLQIKSVVPRGPAWQDGKLQTGDVLVYVNNTCVLGYSHQDVVSLFQSIPPGNMVHLQVCRGYSLPFDPDDPNTEIVTTVAVSNSPNSEKHNSYVAAGSVSDSNEARMRNATGSDSSESGTRSAKSMPDLSSKGSDHSQPQRHNSADLLNSNTSESTPDILDFNHQGSNRPEYLTVEIVKGNAGFGFTIADSVYGQKVKKILDHPRCKLLQEGDILTEINGKDVHGMTHTEVVQVLKDCTCGDSACITVQRGGLPKGKGVKMRSTEDVIAARRSIGNSSSHSFILPPSSRSTDAYVPLMSGVYRSKTPTADLYSSKDKEAVLSNRPKTPLVDTRNWTKSPSSDSLPSPSDPSHNPALSADVHTVDGLPVNKYHEPLSSSKKDESVQGNRNNAWSSDPSGDDSQSLNAPEAWKHEDLSGTTHPQHCTVSEKVGGSSWYTTLGRLRNTYWADQNSKDISGGPEEIRTKYSDSQDVNTSNISKYEQEHVSTSSHCRQSANNSFEDNNTPSHTGIQMWTSRSNLSCHDSYSSNAHGDWKPGSLPLSRNEAYRPRPPLLRNNPYNNQLNSSLSYGQYSPCNGPVMARDLPPASPGNVDSSFITNVLNSFPPSAQSPSDSHYDSLSKRKHTTSFEHESPFSTGVIAKGDSKLQNCNHNYGLYGSGGLRPPMLGRAPDYLELNVTLLRQESGFGFRIVGGTEEGSQVSIGHIVPGGAADIDGCLHSGDEIVSVDNQSVLNTSHHHVVQLMGNAALKGRVTLGIRRRTASLDSAYHTRSTESIYPYDVTVTRKQNEGFGFVIISSVSRAGSTIGRILENSPADRCGQLHVGDRILAVNGISILSMHHGDIVNLIKDSGYSVTLTVGPPQDDASSTASTSQRGEDHLIDQEDQYHAVELHRGTRGFGFSIRGGREFQNMPLFVLRIAENGPASEDGKLQVGDQIIEINGINTKNMTHVDAIELIRQGGNIVRLLVKRGNQLPAAVVDHPSPITSGPPGFSNPIGMPSATSPVRQNSPWDPPTDYYGWSCEPH